MFWNSDHKIHRMCYSGTGLTEGAFEFDSRRIVLAPGCYDVLHYSHVDYLQRAALLGDRLIVALNSDSSVKAYKPSRPIIPELWRARQLVALSCVDEVIIFPQPTPIDVIRFVKPRIVVAGAEWLAKNILSDVTTEHLGQVVYLPESVDHISTTILIEKLKKCEPST